MGLCGVAVTNANHEKTKDENTKKTVFFVFSSFVFFVFGFYFAAGSLCMTPKMLPSVSLP